MTSPANAGFQQSAPLCDIVLRDRVTIPTLVEVSESIECMCKVAEVLKYTEHRTPYQYICSVYVTSNLPIDRFANCATQSANYLESCPICKSCHTISFHNMNINNVDRQQSEILTKAISVNLFY